MGLYMSTPCREVDAEEGVGNNLQYAVGEMQGWRSNMEDAHIACLDLKADLSGPELAEERQRFLDGIAVFGVFDGHGGKEVSLFVKDNYLRQLLHLQSFKEGNIEQSLTESFHHIDAMLNNIEYSSVLKEYKKRPNPSEMTSKSATRGSSGNTPVPEGSPALPPVSIFSDAFPPTPGADDFFGTEDIERDSKLLLKEMVRTHLAGRQGGKASDINLAFERIINGESEELSEEELAERKEQEEEDKYFDEVLRANTEEFDASEAPCADLNQDTEISEEEEEDNYFEAVLKANTERSSEFLEEDSEEGSDKGGVLLLGEKIQNTHEALPDHCDVPTQDVSTEITLVTDTADSVVDFTMSLTMTAMEKGPAPVPFSLALSKSRPSTSLSFSSPSNPFGKGDRAKSDDDENKLEANILHNLGYTTELSKVEPVNTSNSAPKIDEKIDPLPVEKINLSTFSSAATAIKNAQLANVKKSEELKASQVGVKKEEEEEEGSDEGPNKKGSKKGTEFGGLPFRGVNGRPVTMYTNGVPSCNLPDHRVTAGCTAIVALKKGNKLYVANAGDSRGVLCRGGLPCPSATTINQIRSLGDLKYKQVNEVPCEDQMITAEPDISVTELLPTDQFFILGCDGIWDCLTCQEACDLVNDRLNKGMSLMAVVDEVLQACLAVNPKLTAGIGGDNMTCLITLLNVPKDPHNQAQKTTHEITHTHSNGLRKNNFKFQLSCPP